MKTLLALSMLLVSSAQAAQYDCASDGTNKYVRSEFEFTLSRKSGYFEIKNLIGEVIDRQDDESSFFANTSVKNNSKYKPAKYKGSVQFKISSKKGTDLWAELILERKKNSYGEIPAHLIYHFDQNGGTDHLLCQVRY